jgi:RNA polymerase sigma-70 factor (ECF subfamily)
MNSSKTPTGSIAANAATEAVRDAENAEWLRALRSTGRDHEQAVAKLHALLVRAARFEVHRRARAMSMSSSQDLDDLVLQSADDALVAVLAHLDSFEGRSAFTTWAYKFSIHISGVAVRKHAWRNRAIPTPDDALGNFESTLPSPEQSAEQHEVLRGITQGIETLTTRQREVMLALCVSDVPIDVLADRLGSTRGAIYKSLFDARAALRKFLDSQGINYV